MVDVKKALTFPFNDQNWVVKLLIGLVLTIIPIVNFFSMGYVYEVFKKVVNKQEPFLPEWDNWGDLFKKGLMLFLIALVYAIIPAILFGAGMGMISRAAMMGAYGYGQPAVGSGIFGGLLAFVGGALLLIVELMLPMVFAHYAKNNENFGSAFKIGEIISNIFKVIGDYLLAIVVLIGIAIVIGLVMMIPILGWIAYILAIFYIFLVAFVLFAMACSGAYTATK